MELEARNNGAQIRNEYGAALQGFSVTLPQRALDLLRRNPNVASIEADQPMSLTATQSPATWGLDRIDQHRCPVVVLELRDVRGHLRSWIGNHLRLVHQRHRHEHHQRYVDGLAARGRCSRTVRAAEPVVVAAGCS